MKKLDRREKEEEDDSGAEECLKTISDLQLRLQNSEFSGIRIDEEGVKLTRSDGSYVIAPVPAGSSREELAKKLAPYHLFIKRKWWRYEIEIRGRVSFLGDRDAAALYGAWLTVTRKMPLRKIVSPF
jgi:hypothetical protein